MAAIWVGTAKGDIEYYLSNVAKQRLAKPASITSILQMTTAGVPSWVDPSGLAAQVHKVGLVDFAPDANYGGGSFADVSGATKTLVTTRTCTFVVFTALTAYMTFSGSGKVTQLNTVINAVSKGFSASVGSESPPRNQSILGLSYATGVPSGSRICKLQAMADSGDATHVTNGTMLILAIGE